MTDLRFLIFVSLQVFLQSSGVISKKKSSSKQKPKAAAAKRNNNQNGLNNTSSVSTGRKEKEDTRPATGSSTARKLDEMFKVIDKIFKFISID